MTSSSVFPLQTALVATPTASVAALLAADPGGSVLSEQFHLFLAETLPILANANVESSETAEGEPATPLPGRPSKVPHLPLPKSVEEPEQFWLTLCPIPTTITCQSKLEFGPATDSVVVQRSPVHAPQVTGQLQSSGTSTAGVDGELQSSPEAFGVPVQEGGLPLRARNPPVVLEGLMWDRTTQPNESVVDASDELNPRIVQSDTKGDAIAKCSPKAAPDEIPVARKPGNSGNTESGQQGADGDREQRPASARHSNKQVPLNGDATWTNSHAVVVEARSREAESPGAMSAMPARSTPIDPASDPGSETTTNTPRSLTVRIHETAGKPVDVRFVESRGTVKVAIRTEDNQLATAIATGLTGFERGLERRGWSSDLRVPLALQEMRPSGELPTAKPETTNPEVAVTAMDLAQNEHDPARRHRTNWDEEIEDRTTATALRRLSLSREEL